MNNNKDIFKMILAVSSIIIIVLAIRFTKSNVLSNGTDDDINVSSSDISLSMIGNVMLSDKLITRFNSAGTNGFLSEDLSAEIKNSDIAMMNQVFSLSSFSSEYNANGRDFHILRNIGINLCSLSNSFFMKDAGNTVSQTLSNLKSSKVKYAGAGIDYDAASKPATVKYNGKVIGLLSLNLVDKDTPGVAVNGTSHVAEKNGIYGDNSTDSICYNIKQAKNSCDYLILSVSWGNDSSTIPTKAQRQLSKDFIDAGVDLVAGCNKLVQGIEYYKDRPIIYSLGNFLNTSYHTNTELLKLSIHSDNTTTIKVIPCVTEAYRTQTIKEDEYNTFFNTLKTSSFGVKYSSKGIVERK